MKKLAALIITFLLSVSALAQTPTTVAKKNEFNIFTSKNTFRAQAVFGGDCVQDTTNRFFINGTPPICAVLRNATTHSETVSVVNLPAPGAPNVSTTAITSRALIPVGNAQPTSYTYGVYSWAGNFSDANADTIFGVSAGADQLGAGTASNVIGGYFVGTVEGGTASNLYGVRARVSQSTGVVTQAHTISARAPSGTGYTGLSQLTIEQPTTAGNDTNILIGATTSPSGDWNIYSSSTRSDYFAGSATRAGMSNRVGSIDCATDSGNNFFPNSPVLCLNRVASVDGTANTEVLNVLNRHTLTANAPNESVYAIRSYVTLPAVSYNGGWINALDIGVNDKLAGNTTDLKGEQISVYKSGTGTAAKITGLYVQTGATSAGAGVGVVTENNVIYARSYDNGGSIATGHVIRAAAAGGNLTYTSGLSMLTVEQTTTAVNDVNVLLGTSTIPSGDWNIYSASTRPSYFAGPVQTAGNIGAIVTKTGNYTATATDYTILFNVAAATLTLPAAATNTGRIYVVKKVSASAGTITIDPNASELIDGAATNTYISAQWSALTIQCDGAGWYVLTHN